MIFTKEESQIIQSLEVIQETKQCDKYLKIILVNNVSIKIGKAKRYNDKYRYFVHISSNSSDLFSRFFLEDTTTWLSSILSEEYTRSMPKSEIWKILSNLAGKSSDLAYRCEVGFDLLIAHLEKIKIGGLECLQEV